MPPLLQNHNTTRRGALTLQVLREGADELFGLHIFHGHNLATFLQIAKTKNHNWGLEFAPML
jgi:hypothetical protein